MFSDAWIEVSMIPYYFMYLFDIFYLMQHFLDF